MIVVNPPFTLESELAVILPALQSALAEGQGGDWSRRLADRRDSATLDPVSRLWRKVSRCEVPDFR